MNDSLAPIAIRKEALKPGKATCEVAVLSLWVSTPDSLRIRYLHYDS